MALMCNSIKTNTIECHYYFLYRKFIEDVVFDKIRFLQIIGVSHAKVEFAVVLQVLSVLVSNR